MTDSGVPVLTFDPKTSQNAVQAVAAEPAAPSAQNVAAAASEAVQQMDTSSLTEEELKVIDEFIDRIDITNTDHVLLYGADAQKKIWCC